jgi:hypothetical protein
VSALLRLLTAGLTSVILVAVAAAMVDDPHAMPPGKSHAAPGPSPTATAPVVVNPSEGPAVPAHGAYLGAWVGPPVFTQANEIAAVDSLQQQIGRPLDIVHTYLKWTAPFPTASDLAFLRQGSTLLISWGGTDTAAITSGTDDGWIRTRAEQIKALGKPVFLEWRWEMDRPNLRSQVGSPAAFIAAWDHIRAIFAAVGVRNAAWVWCPTANGFADSLAPAYYPGDAEVDWVCADAYPPYGVYASFASTVDPFLSWAARRHKPVMIGEFGVPESYPPQQRAQWLLAAQQAVEADRQVKAIVYFDDNAISYQSSYSYALGYSGPLLSAFRVLAGQRYFNPGRAG